MAGLSRPMKQHEKNALELALFLEKNPKMKKVIYPGLASHPQHKLAKKQMQGFSGLISVLWDGPFHEIVQFTKNLKVFTLAESLGGVESLINHPETMTHASVPQKQREQLGITSQLLRFSVGIESCDSLKKDINQAIEAI